MLCVLQCLWHCDAFRRIIEMHPPEVFQGQPVVHSLALLFRALSEAELRFASVGHRCGLAGSRDSACMQRTLMSVFVQRDPPPSKGNGE